MQGHLTSLLHNVQIKGQLSVSCLAVVKIGQYTSMKIRALDLNL